MATERGNKFVELENTVKELDSLLAELKAIGDGLSSFGYALSGDPTTIYFTEGFPAGANPKFSHGKLKQWIDSVRDKVAKAQDLERKKHQLESELGTKLVK